MFSSDNNNKNNNNKKNNNKNNNKNNPHLNFQTSTPPNILVFPQRLALGHFKEALGVNLVEGREKELPELKKLRSPW